ncbi:MAG: flagellar basal body L-ring protein FlgH [Sphingomonadales bacterium]|nr:flagellar basal body L-ring protein FlgH [Sphingomonadales bacterium]
MSRRIPAVFAAAAALLPAPALAGKIPTGFAASLPVVPAAPQPATGAIFNVQAGYAALVTGARAHGIGDPLTIIINETTSSSKTASSKTERTGSEAVTPPTTGPFSFLKSSALNAGSQGSFNGQGNAAQTNAFSGSVAVTIAEVRANGTALVRGEKVMLLSQGQEWIQFSGIVRLADIDVDNTVPSSKVADAKVEYAGNGAIQKSSREGWLSKLFNFVTPF